MHIRWTEYAVDQLDALVDSVAERRGVEAARAVADRLFERVRALRELPLSAPRWAPAKDATFRRLVVGEYVLLYRVDTGSEALFVLSVRHSRQKPLEPDEVPEP